VTTYGSAHAPAGTGGVVTAVTAGSAAEAAGVLPGDTVIAVEGHRLRDVIDWMWYTADSPVDVTLLRGADELTLTLERGWDQEVGVAFADVLFDGIRTCDNACLFCFVSQLPSGLRDSLYVRDDDFRLSFLSGNFVTLTNLTDDDAARIIEQRLTPLYVSLHAVTADVRGTLVCATADDGALQRIDELLAEGIELHVQIVLVPGLNDGEELQRTLQWLAERDSVTSVGVVPLGYTSAQQRFARSYEDPAAAAAVLDALELWRAGMTEERGERWVYAADEFYLAAGREFPSADQYDGYPQFENGIGMARAFLDEFVESTAEADGTPPPGEEPHPVVLVTGELFAPVLRRLSVRLGDLGVEARVLAVRNTFLGGDVSVAGLLTGRDVIAAVREDLGGAVYLLPDVMVNSDGLLLDDVSAADLPALTGKDVRVIPSDAASLVEEVQIIGKGGGA
jgi:putative radical SAM enzyme (TIGR03279 family)